MKVLMRLNKCTCGCRGRDPWHAKWLNRVVRNVQEVREPLDRGFMIIARGTIRVPWGDEVNVVHQQVTSDGRSVDLGWSKEAL